MMQSVAVMVPNFNKLNHPNLCPGCVATLQSIIYICSTLQVPSTMPMLCLYVPINCLLQVRLDGKLMAGKGATTPHGVS